MLRHSLALFLVTSTSVGAMPLSKEYQGLNKRELILLEMDRPFHLPLKAELARFNACKNHLGLAKHYINWMKTYARSQNIDLKPIQDFDSLLRDFPQKFHLRYCSDKSILSSSQI